MTTYHSKIIKSILTIIISAIIIIAGVYVGVIIYNYTESIMFKILDILTIIMLIFICIITIDFQYYNIKWNLKKIKNEKNNNFN
jgi:hypothetical protein